MIKKLKPALILAGVALVLGILLWVLVAFVLPKEEAGEEKGNEVVLMNTNLSEADSLEIKNSFDDYKLVKLAKDSYYIDGKKGYPVSGEYVVSLLDMIGELKATKKVVENPSEEQLKEYGLAHPVGSFTVTNDADSYRFDLGITSASGNYYCRKSGDDAVYLIGTSIPDMVLLARYQFYSDSITSYSDAVSEQGGLTAMELEGKNRKEAIAVKINDDLAEDEVGTSYIMTAPIRHSLANSATDNLVGLLSALSTSSIVGDNTEEGALKKFGLDDPAATFSAVINGKKEVFYFGDISDAGMQYCYRKGGKFVHAVDQAESAILEASLVDFCENMIYTRAADALSRIEISGDGKNYTIKIGDKDDEGNMDVTINHRKVESESFSDFYMHILNIGITGMDEEPQGEDPYVRVEFTVKETGKVETMEFYPIDDLKCFCALNGEGRFVVDTMQVDLILENAQHLYDRETIELEW